LNLTNKKAFTCRFLFPELQAKNVVDVWRIVTDTVLKAKEGMKEGSLRIGRGNPKLFRDKNKQGGKKQTLWLISVSLASVLINLLIGSGVRVCTNEQHTRRSQRPRGLRRRSAAEQLLGSWVRMPPGAWVFVLYSVCVVTYRSLRWADPSSREVLQTVVCVWVWSSDNKQPRHLQCAGRRGKDYETKRNNTPPQTRNKRINIRINPEVFRKTDPRGRAV
jgi:hypothetical protein